MHQLKIYVLHSNKNAVENLEKVLVEIETSNAKIIDPADFDDYFAEDYKKKNFAMLTFDDGYEQKNPEVVAILREKKLRALSFIFPLTHNMEEIFIDWDFWREASDVFEIGSHSLTHSRIAMSDGGVLDSEQRCLSYWGKRTGERLKPSLVAAGYDQLREKQESPHDASQRIEMEVYMSKQIIERCMGKECRFFAYPWGIHNSALVNIVRNCGFQAAFTTSDKFDGSKFTIPRIDVVYRDKEKPVEQKKKRYFLINKCEVVYES